METKTKSELPSGVLLKKCSIFDVKQSQSLIAGVKEIAEGFQHDLVEPLPAQPKLGESLTQHN